jgi:acyl-coenzyme A synthetase/AMP-(fatty) acid ligase
MIYQRLGNKGIQLGSLFGRAARRHPTSTLTLDHDLDMVPGAGRVLRLAKIQEIVDDVASRLWHAGLRTGDHLVVYKSNNFDITITACAAARMGIVPVLLSSKLEPAIVLELMARLGRPHLLSDVVKLTDEEFSGALDRARIALSVGGSHGEAIAFDDLAGCAQVSEVPMPPDHSTLITHTSGTTGVPKLAVHTGRTFEARYRPQSMAAWLVPRKETVAIHVSFVHSRLFTALPIALLHGHSVVMMADDSPEHVASLFAWTRPGLIEAHPNTFLSWEGLDLDPRRPLANVLVFSSTFDAIHPRTVEAMLGVSHRRGATFVQMYGQSEVGPITGRIYTRRRGMPAGRCVGFLFPLSTAVRVVPRDGQKPSRDNPGFIEVKSDGRITTYFGEEARWEKQVHDGWWRMGDVGYLSRLGCLHLQDREVDLIPGIDSTLEVEDHLMRQLPQLSEIVIVSGRDSQPVPVICTRNGLEVTDEQWAQVVRDLPAMAPRVHLALEDLPQTATTKIRRLELARRIEQAA